MNRAEIERGIEDFKVRELTMAKLKKAGLPIPFRPVDAAEGVDLFTEWESLKKKHGGIANIPYAELGDFLDRWTQMLSYARWVEAVADIDQATAREIRDTIKKQLYCIQEGGRELRDAAVNTEPMYIEWEKRYIESLSVYLLSKALREGYEYRSNAISREISRRGQDQLDTRRGVNRGVNA